MKVDLLMLLMIANGQKPKSNEKTALQILTEKHKEYKQAKYKDLPQHAICFEKFTDKTTNGLTKCVIAWLKLNKYFVERTGNEGRIIDQRQTFNDVVGNTRTIGSIKRVYSTGTRGTSDLKAIINGRFVAIEIKCKFTKDRQRSHQLEYQKQVETSGGVYVIAKDFQGFYDWLNEYKKRAAI